MANLEPVQGVLIDDLIEEPFNNGRVAVIAEGLALPVGLDRDHARFNVGAITAAAEACDIRALYITNWENAGTTNMTELPGLLSRRDFLRSQPKSSIVAPYFATVLGEKSEQGRSAAIHVNVAEISNRALNDIEVVKLPDFISPEDRWPIRLQIWYDAAVKSGLAELATKSGALSVFKMRRILKRSGVIVSFLPTLDDLENEVVFGFLKKSLAREKEA